VSEGGRKIDPFEVTRSEYLAFWRATADGRNILGLPADCGFKSTVNHSPSIEGWPTLTEAEARLPVTGVDHCDARAYCRWAGKRLCAGDDGKPLRVPFDTRKTFTTTGEWQLACEAAAIVASTCNTTPNGQPESKVAAVGSFPGCKSPSGTYDLFGNVGEWIDLCTDVNPQCRIVGGSSEFRPETMGCKSSDARYDYAPSSRRAGNLGFRCCAD
jgi:formylglycine-generating enzyme required for sulfatase activity